MNRFGLQIQPVAHAGRGARLAPLTVDQYHAMLESGILREGAPIELLDGLLVWKDRSAKGADPMTVGTRHAVCIHLLSALNARLSRHGAHLRTQSPITIRPMDEPEPDGAIVQGRIGDYTERHPSPAEVLCVIEVSDSSLDTDRGNKLERYASAGIAQYMIVNLVENRVEMYTDPDKRRKGYRTRLVLSRRKKAMLRIGEGKEFAVPVARLLT